MSYLSQIVVLAEVNVLIVAFRLLRTVMQYNYFVINIANLLHYLLQYSLYECLQVGHTRSQTTSMRLQSWTWYLDIDAPTSRAV